MDLNELNAGEILIENWKIPTNQASEFTRVILRLKNGELIQAMAVVPLSKEAWNRGARGTGQERARAIAEAIEEAYKLND